MIILGIDPGYDRLGVAVLKQTGKGRGELLHSECFETTNKKDFHDRLNLVGEHFLEIISKWKPQTISIENVFITKNQKTGMRVAEVRGALIFLATQKDLIVKEYSPLQVKSVIAGYGKADKRQVMSMIPKLISIKKNIKHDDEYDAIAVALTATILG